MRTLPPLRGLRAFEAAARHLSFARAAEELNVTPAAISHQIKGLEDYLGVLLFRRMTRAIMLTDEAQTVLPLVTEGFDRLGEAGEALKAADASGTLTVTLAPTFAEKWLVPRLADFSKLYPDINVRLDASMQIRDFDRDGIDVAVRYGSGDYPGMRVERLFGHRVWPVCHPDLASGDRPLKEPADLRHHTLLHVDWSNLQAPRSDWSMWLASVGVEDLDTSRGPVFTVESMAINAAMRGDGVALASAYAVEEEVRDGKLVIPFPRKLVFEQGFWLVEPKRRVTRAKVEVFRDWILTETMEMRRLDEEAAD